MGKFTLKAGAEVDVLTQDELERQIDRLEKALQAQQADEPTIRRVFAEITTDGSGNISGGVGAGGSANVIYECPPGWVAFVHRILVYVPGTAVTTGSLVVCRNANIPPNVEYFYPGNGSPSTNVAPAITTDGTYSGLRVNGGDALVVGGSGLPVSTAFYFTLQIRMWRTSGKVAGSASDPTPDIAEDGEMSPDSGG